jgi:hypothetical protein
MSEPIWDYLDVNTKATISVNLYGEIEINPSPPHSHRVDWRSVCEAMAREIAYLHPDGMRGTAEEPDNEQD